MNLMPYPTRCSTKRNVLGKTLKEHPNFSLSASRFVAIDCSARLIFLPSRSTQKPFSENSDLDKTP